MDEYESLSHSKCECKYHVVFIPKCRRKTLYGELRRITFRYACRALSEAADIEDEMSLSQCVN